MFSYTTVAELQNKWRDFYIRVKHYNRYCCVDDVNQAYTSAFIFSSAGSS